MALDANLQHHLEALLLAGGDGAARPDRLVDDVRRLCARIQCFLAMHLLESEPDCEALELACYALQLPARRMKALPAARLGPITLRERAEQAADMLPGAVGKHAGEGLLARSQKILRQIPLRSPALPESRLLADALNLDDFGVLGLVVQTMQLARQQAGISQLVDGIEKRRLYGYWEIRLKEGFHFDAVRQLARQRLVHAQATADLLLAELREDQAP